MALFKHKRFIATLIIAWVSMNTNAHLMVSQQGTINIVDEAAFVVVSIPISAFEGVDENQDGQVSMIEFNQHRKKITQEIESKFILVDSDKSIQLIDILLSPVQDHHSQGGHFKQLTVMGKFELMGFSNSFKLKADLFGTTAEEKVLKITVIGDKNQFKQVVQLTPDSPTARLVSTPKSI